MAHQGNDPQTESGSLPRARRSVLPGSARDYSGLRLICPCVERRSLDHMAFQFSKFLSSLPARAGYCVECLSQMYGDSVETIGEYLGDSGIASHHAHCGICGEHKKIFRARPSSLA
jgi:hypothetical protein